MKKNIQDESLFSLLDKMFKKKIFNTDKIFSVSHLLLLERNILIPLLCNIYFDQLDWKIQRIIKKYTKKNIFNLNLLYFKSIKITPNNKLNKSIIKIASLNLKKKEKRYQCWYNSNINK